MILENDRPYEAEDDGRATVNDVRNVYVDKFDLRQKQDIMKETEHDERV